MGCRGRSLLAGLTVVAGLWFATSAAADSLAPPWSYKQVAPGDQFVFVMIVPGPVEAEVVHWNEKTAAEVRAVRRRYTRTGMYRNDGSTDPLWVVDWYAYGVHLAPDGVHLIRPGPWASLRDDRAAPDLDVEAVSFFADGRLLRTYRVGELVDAPGGFGRSVSHYQWQKEGRLVGEFEYLITTLDGNRFVFDVRTGDVVSASRMARVYRWGWWVTLGAAAGAVGYWLIRRRRRVEAAPGRDG